MYPERTGYLLGGAILISYLGCFPFFIITAHLYANFLKKERLERATLYSKYSKYSK